VKYEHGYTLSSGGETKTVILGIIEESELKEKQIEVDDANMMEREPGIRGQLLSNPATYFVRKLISEV